MGNLFFSMISNAGRCGSTGTLGFCGAAARRVGRSTRMRIAFATHMLGRDDRISCKKMKRRSPKRAPLLRCPKQDLLGRDQRMRDCVY